VNATISIPEAVRERLRTHGNAGMTDVDIVVALMDRVDREDLVRKLRKQHASTPPDAYLELDDV